MLGEITEERLGKQQEKERNVEKGTVHWGNIAKPEQPLAR